MGLNSETVAALFEEQLSSWEQARSNYIALENVLVKELTVRGYPFKVQFNPARIVSSAAKVDSKSISERKCFLCKENRPVVQRGIDFSYNGDTDSLYTVLVNPFPIFPRHLTIPLLAHTHQLIAGKFGAMLTIAEEIGDFTLFYNGPKCGASAPDHFHFQAGNRGFLTIEREIENMESESLFSGHGAQVSLVKGLFRALVCVRGRDKGECETILERVFSSLPLKEGEPEPMVNIICWYSSGQFTTLLYPRERHRPSHYFAEGDENILLSPASVDMGGVLITPLQKDFEKIDSSIAEQIFDQICVSEEDSVKIAETIKKILNDG